MPDKRHNHFVPQFYLRIFSGSFCQVDLYNIKSTRIIRNVSVAGQAAGKKLYGDSDTVENAFMQMEGDTARLIRNIESSLSLPPRPSEDWNSLLRFIAFQTLRTKLSGEQTQNLMEQMIKCAVEDYENIERKKLEEARIRISSPVLVSLSAAPEVARSIEDLHAVLLSTNGICHFVTSDNPVVIYNQYCEGINGLSTVGALSRGIQVFFPISPSLCLILYDPSIYKAGTAKERTARIISPLDSDILQINRLQYHFAENNLYFGRWADNKMIIKITNGNRGGQKKIHMKTQKAYSTDPQEESDTGSILLHGYRQSPNLDLKLSFISMKRDARRVPKCERAHSFRKSLPGQHDELPPELLGKETIWKLKKPIRI